MSKSQDVIAKAAASIKHSKNNLADHPYLKHGGDKKQLRQKKNELSNKYRELLEENERLR